MKRIPNGILFMMFFLACSSTMEAQTAGLQHDRLGLPIDETLLKSEFSLRYNIRRIQLEDEAPGTYPTWTEMAPGDYFTSIRLQRDSIPECKDLQLLRILLSKTNQISHPGGHTSAMTYRIGPIGEDLKVFLLGIAPNGKIHYISGDIYLDPLATWLADPSDIAAIARTRLYFLSPEKLTPIKAKEGHTRFEAQSAVLKTKVIIDLQDENRFMIARKSEPDIPLYTYGNWTME